MRWLNKKIRETRNYLHMSPSAYEFDSFVRSWNKNSPINWRNVTVPFEHGLVSIVLPAFNGEKFVSEAMESILSQTYQNIEVVAINDGSHDKTGEILDDYAAKDSRVKVYHQQNQKIPLTLSRGVRLARGEFLTWTSVDNRLKKNCIEMLVGSLRRNPRWDMVYANIDIIDAAGNPLTNSDWYKMYQAPFGSEHIHLPADTAELNMWSTNFIGAAFLYRARVAFVIGDYSSSRFLTEDFDYWMKVNELMTLRHVDFTDCIYDYRYHDDSLTSKHRELGITSKKKSLAEFDEFRRSFYLTQSAWIITDDGSVAGQDRNQSIRQELENRKSILIEGKYEEALTLSQSGIPLVHIHCSDTLHSSCPLPVLHNTACHVYLCTQQGSIATANWDLFISTQSTPATDLIRLEDSYRGWWSVSETSDLISLCDIKAKNKQLSEIELQVSSTKPDTTPERTVRQIQAEFNGEESGRVARIDGPPLASARVMVKQKAMDFLRRFNKPEVRK